MLDLRDLKYSLVNFLFLPRLLGRDASTLWSANSSCRFERFQRVSGNSMSWFSQMLNLSNWERDPILSGSDMSALLPILRYVSWVKSEILVGIDVNQLL